MIEQIVLPIHISGFNGFQLFLELLHQRTLFDRFHLVEAFVTFPNTFIIDRIDRKKPAF